MWHVQGGPLPVISGFITPLIGVITPQLPIYFRPFIGVLSPFKSGSGAHLVPHSQIFRTGFNVVAFFWQLRSSQCRNWLNPEISKDGFFIRSERFNNIWKSRTC